MKKLCSSRRPVSRFLVPDVVRLASYGLTIIFITGCSGSFSVKTPLDRPLIIVYQPSHQTDTGVDFSEAAVCNSIAETAIETHTAAFLVRKVCSYDVPGLRYARQGSNTRIEHTTRMVGDALTGYAWELRTSNALKPDMFVSIHNNGATNDHAVWGFIHEGDEYEGANRKIAARLIAAIADATGLEDRGVHFDSSVGRNDYRCASTGKRAFFSLDENMNSAPYRVLLEIGDNAVSRELLEDPVMQRLMGEVIARELELTFRP